MISPATPGRPGREENGRLRLPLLICCMLTRFQRGPQGMPCVYLDLAECTNLLQHVRRGPFLAQDAHTNGIDKIV
jgi:hypothetical protein